MSNVLKEHRVRLSSPRLYPFVGILYLPHLVLLITVVFIYRGSLYESHFYGKAIAIPEPLMILQEIKKNK